MSNNTKAFENILLKLDYYSSSSFEKDIANEIADKIQEEAIKKYASYNINNVSFGKENKGNGELTLYAKREGLTFIEYGTGRIGEQHKHPTYHLAKNVPITGKWYYYYPSQYKTTKNGIEGWMWGNRFVRGRPAQAQMYNSSMYARNNIKKIINNLIKGKIK